MSTVAPHRRTLWEEGRRPGLLVTPVAGLVVLAALLLDLQISTHLGLLFDVAFVLVCIGAALAVRPRDFFMVGVFPPLLMGVTVALLAVLDRGAIADETDGLVQALVSGLAHHARALVAGYGLTLGVLALRQVAIRNAGTIRAHGARGSAEPTRSAAHSPR